MKWCNGCRTNKCESAFSLNRSTPSGLQDYCKACKKQTYEEMKEEVLAKQRAYWARKAAERAANPPKKLCADCKQSRLAKEFRRGKADPDGVCCKECRGKRIAALLVGDHREYKDKMKRENPQRWRAAMTVQYESQKLRREALTDSEVASMIRRRSPELSGVPIPQTLIEAKRVNLKIQRILRGKNA